MACAVASLVQMAGLRRRVWQSHEEGLLLLLPPLLLLLLLLTTTYYYYYYCYYYCYYYYHYYNSEVLIMSRAVAPLVQITGLRSRNWQTTNVQRHLLEHLLL